MVKVQLAGAGSGCKRLINASPFAKGKQAQRFGLDLGSRKVYSMREKSMAMRAAKNPQAISTSEILENQFKARRDEQMQR